MNLVLFEFLEESVIEELDLYVSEAAKRFETV